MDETEIQEQQPNNGKPNNNPQLISIRTKLAAPNNILPGCMLHSQQPIHLLPFHPDFQSQPGFKMLLDQSRNTHPLDSIEKNRHFRSKSNTSKPAKHKFMDQCSSPNINSSSKKTQLSTSLYRDTSQNDPLAFLNKRLKNMFDFAQQIVFVSKTAFLNPLKNGPWNTKIPNDKDKLKDSLITYLKQTKYFASSSFAFDQPSNNQLSKIPQFPQSPDQQLHFSDNFQSSNIFSAMRCDEPTTLITKKADQTHKLLYMISVRLDYNTKSYGQWFYFKVNRKQQPFSFSRPSSNLFKFMIINMTKSASMFGKGLKISVCRNGLWRKEGINIAYYKNSINRQDSSQSNLPDNIASNHAKTSESYYTLEFTLQIQDGQELHVSYNEPYTYSRLGKVLDRISTIYQTNKSNLIELKRNVICQTYLNNIIEVLTISAKNTNESHAQKKVIFIVSRSHPIQTAGSHVLQGLLNHLSNLLIQNGQEQQKDNIVYRLLQKYILKIVPMINPDGVILGNSRCNIAGYDLNRSWKTAHIDRCKQIHQIKKYIMRYQNRVQMFIDLHAHSKKKNVFAYGCHDISDPFSTREFPFLLSKLSGNDFLFSECRFMRLSTGKKNGRGKDGTARVFLYDALRIPNVFTIENSYCSAKNSPYHYDNSSYQNIGADILKAISLYFSPTFKQNGLSKVQGPTFKNQPMYQQINGKDTDSLSARQGGKVSTFVNVSLTSSTNQGFQLKLSVHSQFSSKTSQKISAVDLRQKYLHELRQNQQNIAIGLTKDGEASESQQQDRIYQLPKTKRLKSQKTLPPKRKPLKRTTTAEKVIGYIKKYKTIEQKPTDKDKKQPQHPPLQKIGSTHSDPHLVRITHIDKNRFYTLANQESIFIPSNYAQDEEEGQKKAIPLKPLKPKPHKSLITEWDPFNHSKKVVTVVDIGLGEYPQMVHDFKSNVVQKIQGKFQLKLPHNKQEIVIPRDLDLKNNICLNKSKDDQIKQYLRRLIRPKQILERKQKLANRQQTAHMTQMHGKQSNLKFSQYKLSQLVKQRARFTERGAF